MRHLAPAHNGSNDTIFAGIAQVREGWLQAIRDTPAARPRVGAAFLDVGRAALAFHRPAREASSAWFRKILEVVFDASRVPGAGTPGPEAAELLDLGPASPPREWQTKRRGNPLGPSRLTINSARS